jgi:hypothetical protein
VSGTILRGLELAAPERLAGLAEAPQPDPVTKVNGTHVHPDCPHCPGEGEEG